MTLRRVQPVDLPKGAVSKGERQTLEPGYDDDGAPEPTIEWGDPCDLYVDEDYQRTISPAGLALIRRVGNGTFSWRKLKLPVVTLNPEGLRVIIDGQHTAIMAATRGINRIPWFLVETFGLEDQADAFVGQNRNRTPISAMQEHKAKVAAGDEFAKSIDLVLESTGIELLMFKAMAFKPGQTMALGAISTLVRRRKVEDAIRCLRVLVKAQLAPVEANHIKAVEQLMFGEEFKGLVQESRITEALTGAAGVTVASEAAMFAARHRVPVWQGLTTELFKAATKRRVSAA